MSLDVLSTETNIVTYDFLKSYLEQSADNGISQIAVFIEGRLMVISVNNS